jgi:hypothetical protein
MHKDWRSKTRFWIINHTELSLWSKWGEPFGLLGLWVAPAGMGLLFGGHLAVGSSPRRKWLWVLSSPGSRECDCSRGAGLIKGSRVWAPWCLWQPTHCTAQNFLFLTGSLFHSGPASPWFCGHNSWRTFQNISRTDCCSHHHGLSLLSTHP